MLLLFDAGTLLTYLFEWRPCGSEIIIYIRPMQLHMLNSVPLPSLRWRLYSSVSFLFLPTEDRVW